jgi:hypothetical protein
MTSDDPRRLIDDGGDDVLVTSVRAARRDEPAVDVDALLAALGEPDGSGGGEAPTPASNLGVAGGLGRVAGVALGLVFVVGLSIAWTLGSDEPMPSDPPRSATTSASELGARALEGGEPASVEPASAEPASAEPASAEPVSVEPASAEPVSVDAPVTDPAALEHAVEEVAVVEAPRAPHRATERPPAETDALAEGTLLLRARSALARGEANDALVAIEEHRTRFRDGTLAPEREALAIDAFTRLGRDAEARRHARRLLRRWPSSPYAVRARERLRASTP